jgi:hypothetical protein
MRFATTGRIVHLKPIAQTEVCIAPQLRRLQSDGCPYTSCRHSVRTYHAVILSVHIMPSFCPYISCRHSVRTHHAVILSVHIMPSFYQAAIPFSCLAWTCLCRLPDYVSCLQLGFVTKLEPEVGMAAISSATLAFLFRHLQSPRVAALEYCHP